MMSNSSSTQQTVKMKLLLVTLACVAAAVAAPAEKQKRDILPGDPRYGTDYHNHHHHAHENEVQITPAAGGYVGSYIVPDTDVQKNSFQVPHKTYGPPNHTPGTPLNNGYLAPTTTEVHHQPSVSVPTYGVPDSTQHIPQHISNTYLQPGIQEVKTTHTPTTYGVPEHDVKTQATQTFETQFKTPAVNAPVTSYGTPVVADVKSTVHSVPDTHVQPTHHVSHERTVVPKVHHQPQHVETKTVARPEVKTPVSQGVFQQSLTDFKSVPTTSFGGFDSLSSTSFNSFPSFDTSFAKVSVPTTFYTQPSFDTGYSSYPVNYPAPSFEHHAAHVQVPQPISVHVTKHVPLTVPVEVPRPYVIRVPEPVHFEYQPQHHFVETKVPVVQQHHVELPKTSQVFQTSVPTFQGNLESFQVPSYQPTTFSKPVHSVHVEKESVTVENPIHTKTTFKTTKEYVQPTDENGGYIY